MATWPVTLPQIPLRAGQAEQERDNVLRSAMGYGPAKLRRRTTVRMSDVIDPFILSSAQKATLETFYDDNAAIPWDWDDGNGLRSFRFKAPPAFRELSCDVWAANIQIEVMP